MSAADDLPNIILIATDQQRSDCLGLAGHPVLQTPNLDFLGASGTHFRSAYAEAPSCIPARRTLISGQAPSANGMVGFQEGVAWDPPHTIAGELSKVGYQCEMVGKMHLFPQRKRYGFHRMALADSTRGLNNDYLDWLSGEVPTDRWGNGARRQPERVDRSAVAPRRDPDALVLVHQPGDRVPREARPRDAGTSCTSGSSIRTRR